MANLTPISSSTVPTLTTAVGKIDLAYTYPQNPDDQTNIEDALAFAKKKIPTTYTTPSAPSNFVVLITDGMQDYQTCTQPNIPSVKFISSCRYVGLVSPVSCQAIKDTGAQVAVVYTPYLWISKTEDKWTYDNIDPMTLTDANNVSQDSTALANCASNSKLFVSTGPNVSIGQALQTIFQNALAQTVLTQ